MLATAKDAARVCRAWELPSLGPIRFVVDLNAEWQWVTVTDMGNWISLPFEWGVNEADPERHGFICMLTSGSPIPAAVAALCRTKPSLVENLRTKLCKHLQEESCMLLSNVKDQAVVEQNLVSSLLGDLPVDQQQTHLELLRTVQVAIQQKREKLQKQRDKKRKEASQGTAAESDTEDEEDYDYIDELPEDARDFFLAAVDEIDAKALPNQERKKIKCAEAVINQGKMIDKWHQGRKETEKAKAALQALVPAAPEAASQALVPVAPKAPASAEVPTQNTAAEHNVDLQALDLVGRSLEPWVRPYVPDKRCKSDSINFTYNRDGEQSWTALYKLVKHSKEDLPEGMPTDRSQVSKTAKSSKRQTQHMCFQYVLRWIWDKAVLTDITTELPSWVTQALLPCENCTEACTELSKLQHIVVPYKHQPAKNINAGKSPLLQATAQTMTQKAKAALALHEAVPATPEAPAGAAVPSQNAAKSIKDTIERLPLKRISPEVATKPTASKKARPAIPSPPQDHPKPCVLCLVTHIELTECPFLPGSNCIDQSRTSKILEITLRIAHSFGRQSPPKSLAGRARVRLTFADILMELQIDPDGNCLFAAMSSARTLNNLDFSLLTDRFLRDQIKAKMWAHHGRIGRRETLAWMKGAVNMKAT